MRTWKLSTLFLGANRESHSNEGPGVGTALGKLDSSDSNERLLDFWGLEEDARRRFNVYKTSIRRSRRRIDVL